MTDMFARLARGLSFASRPDISDFRTPKHDSVPQESIDFFANTAGSVKRAHPGESKEEEKQKPAKRRRRSRRRENPQADTAEAGEHEEAGEHGEEGNIAEQQTAEDANALRAMVNLTVSGSDPPAPVRTFQEFTSRPGCPPWLLNTIRSQWTEPTAVQMQCLPLLALSRDALVAAPTGSGKTGAFLIPTLHHLGRTSKGPPRALIVVPVHELASQIQREAERLAKGSGLKISVLSKSNAKNRDKHTDLLIATPLRLVSLVREGSIDLSAVKTVIFDEADKLFELGFLEQVDEILGAFSGRRVVCALFSATLPQRVEQLASTVLRDPLTVLVGQRNAAVSSVSQRLMFVGNEEGKLLAVRQLLQQGGLHPPVLIFLQSKERAKDLFKELVYDGVNVDVIHADRTVAQRDNIIKRFRSGKIWVLITTDVLGRGIDFVGVNTVINYDFPNSITSYIHRVGRTGRGGRTGQAVTLFTQSETDVLLLRGIANVIRASGSEVPEWMLKLKKTSRTEQRRLARSAAERKTVSTLPRFIKNSASHKKQMIRQAKQSKRGERSKES